MDPSPVILKNNTTVSNPELCFLRNGRTPQRTHLNRHFFAGSFTEPTDSFENLRKNSEAEVILF
jgi:hypothetical protein